MPLNRKFGEHALREDRNKVYGVVIGVVTNNKDPSGKYRVKVRFPWLPNGDESGSASEESDWCRVATFMAGNGRGMFCLPEVKDEVLVAFEHGDMGRPYVIGSLWNATDASTGDNKGGKNNLRSFKSRSGHQLIFCDDKDNGESICLVSNGKAKIYIDDKNKTVEIHDQSDKNKIVIDSQNNKMTITGEDKLDLTTKGDITFKCGGDFKLTVDGKTTIKSTGDAEINTSGKFLLKGSGTGEVNASGALTVKGSTVNIN